MPFDSNDVAAACPHNTEFGLYSSKWTPVSAVAIDLQLEAEHIYLWANGQREQDRRGRFGGYKQSGIGRNLGYEAVIQCQGYHSISGSAGWIV